LEQFTFYEIYAEVIGSMDEVSAGKLIKTICAYEFEDVVPSEMNDKERFYWSNLADTLTEVKEIESAGKIPKRYNRVRHFTFYDNYYNAIKLLNERKSGEFIKAICGYMFKGTLPEFKDRTMQSYFNLCKMKMDLSKQRKSSGKTGGTVKRREKEVDDGIDSVESSIKSDESERIPAYEQKDSATVDDFKRRYPKVKGELYGTYSRYNSELDWNDLTEKYATDDELLSLTDLYEIVKLYLKKYGKTGSKNSGNLPTKRQNL